MNICSPVRKHCAPFLGTGRVHNMFTIDRNKSLVNFTGSDVLRLQKPNHASHLTVGGRWYQRVHCLNLSHSQRGNVCSTNCTKQLSTLYWTHHMTHQLKLNNCAGCMRTRSLLSRCPTYLASPNDSKSNQCDKLNPTFGCSLIGTRTFTATRIGFSRYMSTYLLSLGRGFPLACILATSRVTSVTNRTGQVTPTAQKMRMDSKEYGEE